VGGNSAGDHAEGAGGTGGDRAEPNQQDRNAVSSHTVVTADGKERPGYGLLKSYEDPHERRRKIVSLTSKGDRLAERIVELLV